MINRRVVRLFGIIDRQLKNYKTFDSNMILKLMFQLLFLLSVTIIINAVHKILSPDMI